MASRSRTAPPAGGSATAPGLAFTGLDAQRIAEVGTGLLALGGLSLVAARHRAPPEPALPAANPDTPADQPPAGRLTDEEIDSYLDRFLSSGEVSRGRD